jgi:heme/copper-type cytochrome/quinol oxidase subunit 3
MTSEDAVFPRNIDVSDLPKTVFDTRAALWSGNACLLVIETVSIGALVATYFSTWMTLSPFPPPRVDRLPIIHDPVPDLSVPTIGLAILLISLIPEILVDINSRRMNEGAVRILAIVTLAFSVTAIVMRFIEFDSLHFKWYDNAYGSITWTILGVHLLHLIVLSCEDAYSAVWVWVKGLDKPHAFDTTVLAVYWYWVVALWVLLYTLIYLAPRFL